MAVIEVDHLTKEFRLGALQSLKQNVLNAARRAIGKPVAELRLFKALDDVSFSVERGEVVGIIGHNGAGKSTLLKILAGISTPTHGDVSVSGRIAPLIEVGAGFIPDFTGRENVYLNGAILGMSRKDIARKFDEIVEFAEMAAFIDTPVKRYSSGMQIKLAFSVATSVESEILIVDEVLAVGDLAFQRKCFRRIEELIKCEGRTILIVSHNIRQIQRICTRVALLDHGAIIADGAPAMICDKYYELSDQRIQAQLHESVHAARGQNIRSSGQASVSNITIMDDTGAITDLLHTGCCATICLRLDVASEISNVIIALGFHTNDFIYLLTVRSEGDLPGVDLMPGQHVFSCLIKALPLLSGVYAIRASITAGAVPSTIFYGENLCTFRVINQKESRSATSNEGFFHVDAGWSQATCNCLSADSKE